jgi:hypothetical protein
MQANINKIPDHRNHLCAVLLEILTRYSAIGTVIAKALPKRIGWPNVD